jgi:hypothetical protein
MRITEEWLQSRKPRLKAAGIRCADHATTSARKVGNNFAGRSVGIVCLRTKSHKIFLFYFDVCNSSLVADFKPEYTFTTWECDRPI